jgi:hypothetical protein
MVGGRNLMVRSCFECGGDHKEIIREEGDDRTWCLSCHASFSNRRYWAQNKQEYSKNPGPGDVKGGLCFDCGLLSKVGVIRKTKRKTNLKAIDTWYCWNCDNKKPTLNRWMN